MPTKCPLTLLLILMSQSQSFGINFACKMFIGAEKMSLISLSDNNHFSSKWSWESNIVVIPKYNQFHPCGLSKLISFLGRVYFSGRTNWTKNNEISVFLFGQLLQSSAFCNIQYLLFVYGEINSNPNASKSIIRMSRNLTVV